MKKCKFCNNLFEAPKSLYCSNSCRCKDYYYRNQEQQKTRVLKNYFKYKEPNYEKIREINKRATLKYKNKKRFSGNRLKVLERDGHKCTECHSNKRLVVHHKDETGYASVDYNYELSNNKMENLVTLCSSCHSKLHHKLRRQNKV